MPGFHYRLKPLLDKKQAAKEEAQRALGERQKEQAAEREQLDGCRRERERLESQLAQARRRVMGAAQGASGGAIQARRDYARGLAADVQAAADALAAQEIRVQEAEQRVAAARAELAERSREVDVLEKHRERLEQRFRREVERKEALEQEEMGNVMYLSRRRE
jgi:flagellar biosynthesis chaperone FliJ